MSASWEAWKRALLWVPVFVAFHDCIASVHWVRNLPVSPDAEEGREPSEERPGIVMAERLSPRLYRFTRGDLVLLKSPVDSGKTLMRRLVGIEGDWVAVPGEARVEKIPKGKCWVECYGPQADASEAEDSRTKYGAIPLALIQGTASRVLWPPSSWGALGPHLPPGRIIARGSFSAASFVDEDW